MNMILKIGITLVASGGWIFAASLHMITVEQKITPLTKTAGHIGSLALAAGALITLLGIWLT